MTKRILLVHYSRSGTTSRVAAHIAKELGADLERIEESAQRSGVGGYMRSAVEALAKGLPAIRTQKDPREYDLVVIGTPVWVGTMSSPVRSYLFSHQRRLRNTAFFAVMGGRGADDTLREMALACGATDAPMYALTQAEVEQNRYQKGCAAFIRQVKAALGNTEHTTARWRESHGARAPLEEGS